MPTPVDCLIALGSNAGHREANLNRAMELLSADDRIEDIRQSDWYATRPIGGPAGQGDFLNGAATFRTTLAPLKLLALLNKVEQQVGRERVVRWGPRVIDLDILLYGDEVIAAANDSGLTIPHPRMAFRRFVVEPAAQVAADMRHPIIGWTIAELLDHLRNAQSHVAIFSPERERAAALATEVSRTTRDETVQHVEQLAELRNLPVPPKLLIHDGAWEHSQYVGPTLDISGLSHEQAKTEIVAAIEAMRE